MNAILHSFRPPSLESFQKHHIRMNRRGQYFVVAGWWSHDKIEDHLNVIIPSWLAPIPSPLLQQLLHSIVCRPPEIIFNPSQEI